MDFEKKGERIGDVNDKVESNVRKQIPSRVLTITLYCTKCILVFFSYVIRVELNDSYNF